MRRIVKNRLIKVSILTGLLIIVFVSAFFINQEYINSHTELEPVVVANSYIPAYSVVSKNMFRVTKIPAVAIGPNHASSLDELNDGPFFTKELGLGKNDILYLDRIINASEIKPSDLYGLGTGHVLVSVQTDLIRSCANLVGPGCLVDVYVFKKGDGRDSFDMVISPDEDQRLKELLVVDKKNSESTSPKEEGREALPAVVTFKVPENRIESVKALVEYNETGSIYLIPKSFEGDTYLKMSKLS